MDERSPALDSARLAGLFDLQGSVAFVPGGYGGIGEAIAWALARAGARVAVAGRDAAKAQALAAALDDAGHDALGVAHGRALDVPTSAPRSTRSPSASARLDLLVNCVGIQREQTLAEVTEEAFDEVCRST